MNKIIFEILITGLLIIAFFEIISLSRRLDAHLIMINRLTDCLEKAVENNEKAENILELFKPSSQ